jgi:DNA primase
VPLFEFVIKTYIKDFDLSNAEGRINALTKIAPVLHGIKNQLLQNEYIKLSANWLGLDVEAVSGAAYKKAKVSQVSPVMPQETPGIERQIQREVLKVIFQYPELSKSWVEQLEITAFTHAPYQKVFESIKTMNINENLANNIISVIDDDFIKKGVPVLAVEPFGFEVNQSYVDSVFSRVLEFTTSREIEQIKSRLQREQADLSPPEQDQLFKELLSLEEYRRALRDHALGTP